LCGSSAYILIGGITILMPWVTEFIAAVLVVASIGLLWAGRIDYQQALTLIGIGVGLVDGKQLSRIDSYLRRRYGHLYLLRRYRAYVSALKMDGNTVTILMYPEFFGTKMYDTVVSEALKLFPGKQVIVLRGERIKLV